MPAILERPTRRAALHMVLDPPAAMVRPGQRVRFLLRVENSGQDDQSMQLSLDGAHDGWIARLPVRQLDLLPDGATVLVLRIDVPASAQPGERCTFRVTASGSQRPGRLMTVTAEAIVDA